MGWAEWLQGDPSQHGERENLSKAEKQKSLQCASSRRLKIKTKV